MGWDLYAQRSNFTAFSGKSCHDEPAFPQLSRAASPRALDLGGIIEVADAIEIAEKIDI